MFNLYYNGYHNVKKAKSTIKWGMDMKISYKKLWIELINRDIKKSDLKKLTGLSAGTITKLNKNEPVSVAVLLSICEVLQCDIGDICSAVSTSDSNVPEGS